jgi:hypothetical protein
MGKRSSQGGERGGLIDLKIETLCLNFEKSKINRYIICYNFSTSLEKLIGCDKFIKFETIFLTSERSKIGQNPYIWGPRLRKEAEL